MGVHKRPCFVLFAMMFLDTHRVSSSFCLQKMSVPWVHNNNNIYIYVGIYALDSYDSYMVAPKKLVQTVVPRQNFPLVSGPSNKQLPAGLQAVIVRICCVFQDSSTSHAWLGCFSPKHFTVRGSQFVLKMCPPFLSLLVSGLFRWPRSSAIHLSPK